MLDSVTAFLSATVLYRYCTVLYPVPGTVQYCIPGTVLYSTVPGTAGGSMFQFQSRKGLFRKKQLEKEVDNFKVFLRLIFLLIGIPILTLVFGVTLFIICIMVMILFIEDIIYNRR